MKFFAGLFFLFAATAHAKTALLRPDGHVKCETWADSGKNHMINVFSLFSLYAWLMWPLTHDFLAFLL